MRAFVAAALGAALILGTALASMALVSQARAATAAEIDAEVDKSLADLRAEEPDLAKFLDEAVGVLVFPEIIKGGLIVGGQYGEGALRMGGKTRDYYSTVAASIGLQAGGQIFGYAVLFLTEPALSYLDDSAGWDIGSAPTLVYGDEGWSSSLSVQDIQDGLLVVFFDQEGVMGGLGIQGAKITRITPD